MPTSALEYLQVTIVSARYAPCEGTTTAGGKESSSSSNPEIHTRDVTPFVKALLLAQKEREELARNHALGVKLDGTCTLHDTASASATNEDGTYTDTCTTADGDTIPIPAIYNGLRRTRIHLLDAHSSMNCLFGDPYPGTSKRLYIVYCIGDTELSSSFAEHEPAHLVLRRLPIMPPTSATGTPAATRNPPLSHPQQPQRPCTTSTTTTIPAEIIVPLLLPFLEWPERVHCRMVGRVWCDVIQRHGVAVTIDGRPLHVRLVRGLLAHSYTSLCNLYLTGGSDDDDDTACSTSSITHEDLAAVIPHWRQLRSLDISQCTRLHNATLRLLAASPTRHTLRVLYMKGVTQVTDAGLIAIAEGCRQLRVLDVSLLTQLTDVGMAAVGQHLTQLRALFLRDNFRLREWTLPPTAEVEQLTLWGCIGLRQLPLMVQMNATTTAGDRRLVSLNLWGCHALTDESAEALRGLDQLRSLVVTECHRLTDAFVSSVTRHVPQLNHFHLRYCKRLTDESIYLISEKMPDLYSLDVSFCSRLTTPALHHLIERCGNLLTELRLRSCRGCTSIDERQQPQLVCAVRAWGTKSALAVLDVRDCPVELQRGWAELGFVEQETATGFFTRPARWNAELQGRLVKQMRRALEQSSLVGPMSRIQ